MRPLMRYVRLDTPQPMQVDAFCVPDGNSRDEVEQLHEWCERHGFHNWEGSDEGIIVMTPHHPVLAPPGTWIVKSPEGRFDIIGALAFAQLHVPLQ